MSEHEFEWIQFIGSNLVTFASVFAGAWFAFRFEAYREKSKETDKRIAAANGVIFLLGTTANKLINIKKQVIDPVRNSPMAFLEMRPLMDEEFEYMKLELTDLGFLLETKHRNILMELFVEEERNNTVFSLLKQRSRLHFHELQPRIEGANIPYGTMVELSKTKQILGDRLFNMLKDLTAVSITRVDEVIASHQKAIENLIHAIKDIYPKASLITFDFKKD